MVQQMGLLLAVFLYPEVLFAEFVRITGLRAKHHKGGCAISVGEEDDKYILLN
jgi:hypothetical protein